jgi:hypothetical protein
MTVIPVTHYPTGNRRQFALNRERVQGKPYAKYFNGELWLHDEVVTAIREPMRTAEALDLTPDGLSTLLEPGYHEVENGFCELPDGTSYVASRVPFPGCTGEMFQWWFWWHSVEPARYALWYPYSHISANPVDRDVLTAPGLTHEQRYVGNTHLVTERIGSRLVRISIRFVDPAELGFDTSRFAEAGIVAHACAEVSLLRPEVSATTMVHLARRTESGFELRSRYWNGQRMSLNLGSLSLPLDGVLSTLGLKRRFVGESLAHDQLLHDQIEWTHLASFLADIYGEFGTQEAAGDDGEPQAPVDDGLPGPGW